MCPLQINDFSPEVRSDVVEFFAEFEPLVLKITNDYDSVIFWSLESDCDYLREKIKAEDEFYRSLQEMAVILPLHTLRERAHVLFENSICSSPAVQLSLDFTYD